jgi:hypothetical protein
MRVFMTADGNAAEGMLCLAIHVLRASCELSRGKEVVYGNITQLQLFARALAESLIQHFSQQACSFSGPRAGTLRLCRAHGHNSGHLMTARRKWWTKDNQSVTCH